MSKYANAAIMRRYYLKGPITLLHGRKIICNVNKEGDKDVFSERMYAFKYFIFCRFNYKRNFIFKIFNDPVSLRLFKGIMLI